MDGRRELLLRGAKKNELIAEVTFWYGIDAGKIPDSRLDGLIANLPRMKAQRQIFERHYNASDPSEVYDLWLEAYGNEDLAREQQTRAAWNLVRRHQQSHAQMSFNKE